ncbi:hypothetical protein [Saccharomonospora piscinae]|uniref:hypothetical protein n=1 Tax=Saccharomonospora piscinae TaxID=687388 RepID=UPI000463BE94|nr:hypothetical protein [Saccharomonospora piscinae]
MIVTALYLTVLAALLAGLGSAVHREGPAPDVEPAFARRVAEGVLVLRALGQAYADRTQRLLDELTTSTPLLLPSAEGPANTRA